jgi:hypothetical protein
MFRQLSDELLLDAYRGAVKLGLEKEFISMLRSEIRRRQLNAAEWRGA